MEQLAVIIINIIFITAWNNGSQISGQLNPADVSSLDMINGEIM